MRTRSGEVQYRICCSGIVADPSGIGPSSTCTTATYAIAQYLAGGN